MVTSRMWCSTVLCCTMVACVICYMLGDLGGCGLTEYKPMFAVIQELCVGVSMVPAVVASSLPWRL